MDHLALTVTLLPVTMLPAIRRMMIDDGDVAAIIDIKMKISSGGWRENWVAIVKNQIEKRAVTTTTTTT